VLEILGLFIELYQSETEYLEEFFRGSRKWKQDSNTLLLCFRSCCRFLPFVSTFRTEEETEWQRVAGFRTV
jgi:hypothetical protein